MGTLIRLLIVVAIVGGVSYGVYEYVIKDKVEDQTPEQKACAVEKKMVEESIITAAAERQATGLDVVDPGTYIDKNATLEYYNWVPGGANWVIQPIGTPPC